MNTPVDDIIENIAQDILLLAQAITDENGLKKSMLRNNIKTEVYRMENPVIGILFNDYIDYIESGRKPCSGKKPPVSELREWASKKGLPTDNATLFAIAESIWRTGYTARPILATLEDEIDKSFENKWADDLFNTISNELESIFQK